MRVSRALMAAAVVGLGGVNPAMAACPSNATRASMELWPENSLVAGETVTGTHSCGQRIRCTSGNPRRGLRRSCRWL